LNFAFSDVPVEEIVIEYPDMNISINLLEGNIDADPLFCNVDSNDFTLYDNSPCVGTGEDGANMGAYGVGCEAPYDGPTDVSGVISSNTTWGALSSPYIVTGNILLNEGLTLTIEAGVTVNVLGTKITVTPPAIIATRTKRLAAAVLSQFPLAYNLPYAEWYVNIIFIVILGSIFISTLGLVLIGRKE